MTNHCQGRNVSISSRHITTIISEVVKPIFNQLNLHSMEKGSPLFRIAVCVLLVWLLRPAIAFSVPLNSQEQKRVRPHLDKSVSGKVLSKEDNTPIPGVTVVVKGSTNGTTTDIDGKFQIETKSDSDVLVFSAVGF